MALIRPYADADFAAVTAIWLSSWQSTGVPSPVTLDDLRQRWPQELAKGWVVHVATEDAQIVGFIVWQGDHLEQLFIAPTRQNRGIGKALLDFAKQQIPAFHLTTAAQSRAGRFYLREGLIQAKPGHTRVSDTPLCAMTGPQAADLAAKSPALRPGPKQYISAPLW